MGRRGDGKTQKNEVREGMRRHSDEGPAGARVGGASANGVNMQVGEREGRGRAGEVRRGCAKRIAVWTGGQTRQGSKRGEDGWRGERGGERRRRGDRREVIGAKARRTGRMPRGAVKGRAERNPGGQGGGGKGEKKRGPGKKWIARWETERRRDKPTRARWGWRDFVDVVDGNARGKNEGVKGEAGGHGLGCETGRVGGPRGQLAKAARCGAQDNEDTARGRRERARQGHGRGQVEDNERRRETGRKREGRVERGEGKRGEGRGTRGYGRAGIEGRGGRERARGKRAASWANGRRREGRGVRGESERERERRGASGEGRGVTGGERWGQGKRTRCGRLGVGTLGHGREEGGDAGRGGGDEGWKRRGAEF
jgi:hypothetical protein